MDVLLLLLLLLFGVVLPSRHLDDVFTYNHMVLMSLGSRSHFNAFVVLTRADHLFIHNYIRSLLNIMLTPMLMYVLETTAVAIKNDHYTLFGEAICITYVKPEWLGNFFLKIAAHFFILTR